MELIEVIKKYNDTYQKRIQENRNSLIKAYILYYGKEYQELIIKRVAKTQYCWFITDYIKEVSTSIENQIKETKISHTKNILNILGFEIQKISCLKTGNTFIKEDNNLTITPLVINNPKDQNNKSIDRLLTIVFGNNKVFNYDYETNKIYNFFKYNKSTQLKIIKQIYNKRKISQDELSKINSAIEYVESVSKEQSEIQKYLDIYNLKELYEKTEPKIKNEIIGSNYDFIFQENYHNLLEYLNKKITSSNSLPFQETITEDYRVVAFPIMITNDQTLIHELNHSVTSSLLAHIEETKDSKLRVTKAGLTTINNGLDNP